MSLISFFATTVNRDSFIWESRSSNPLIRGNALAYGDNNWVIVGNLISSKNVAYSIDNGNSWTTSQILTQSNWEDVAFGLDTFVACANSGGTFQLVYSTDGGRTWNNCIRSGWSFNTYALKAITFGNGLFVCPAFSRGGSPPGAILISSDGITFTEVGTGIGYCEHVAFGNNLYMGLGTSSSVVLRTSPDGTTWTTKTAPSEFSSTVNLRFTDNHFYALTSSGIYRSSDGNSWDSFSNPSNFVVLDITSKNGRFYLCGESTIEDEFKSVLSTLDFISWKRETTPTDDRLNNILYSNNILISTSTDASDNIFIKGEYNFILTKEQVEGLLIKENNFYPHLELIRQQAEGRI